MGPSLWSVNSKAEINLARQQMPGVLRQKVLSREGPKSSENKYADVLFRVNLVAVTFAERKKKIGEFFYGPKSLSKHFS